MKNFKTIILFSLLFVFLSACEKEGRLRNKYAGPKKVSLYQWIKQDADGNFTEKVYDIDTLGDILMWDNGSDFYNDAHLYLKSLPVSWGLNGVGGTVGWYCDWNDGETLSFFSEPNKGNIYYVTYTIKSNINGKITLEGVFPQGNSIYKEVIELEKIRD